ncbi:hypothetical protein F2P79_006855 [Pimephales promelas]|nr:hypothetical protein F2P79_006855 [Pimephales promelas]
MKQRTRKYCVKNAHINTNKEELRSARQTVIRWVARRKTTMGAGNSQVCNQTDDLSQEGIILKSAKVLSPPSQTLMDNQSVNTSASQKCPDPNGKNPDPTNTLPVSFSALKPACIKGCTTSELCHWTQCLTTQLLCSSCLYPCTSDACTNKLCPLVSTLLNCEVDSEPLYFFYT